MTNSGIPRLAHRPADTNAKVFDWTVSDLLNHVAAHCPDREALVWRPDGDLKNRQAWSYAELISEGQRVARALLARFEPGERIAIWSANRPEWVLLQIGAAMAGLVIVPINPAFKAREAEYSLHKSRVQGVFYTDSYRDVNTQAILGDLAAHLPDVRSYHSFSDWEVFLAEAPSSRSFPRPDAAGPAMILLTSGTTGNPKGAVLSHRGTINTTQFGEARFALEKGSNWLNSVPMFHSSGCVFAMFCTMWNFGTQILLPGFDPGLVLTVIAQERVHWMMGVPTMAIALLEHPDIAETDMSSLGTFISGGTSVPAELVRRIERELGVEYCMVYGQTEMSGVICHSLKGDTMEHRTSTVGMPYPHTEVRIVDPETGKVLGIDEVGEICLKGYAVFIEYFEQPEATAETIDAGGFNHTGDMGTLRGDGYLTITGRRKEMIIRGGENIYPREVEDFLMSHPDIADIAVFGIPDDRWGEQIVAAVRPRNPEALPDPDALRDYAKARMSRYKVPVHWWFVDSYPQTAAGKIQKFELRRLFLETRKVPAD